MRKYIRVLRSLNSLRKILGFISFWEAAKFDHHLELKTNLEAKSVLVLAPHPDDDVFGLGGTIAKIAKKTQVTIAYFCDGAAGLPEDRNPEIIEEPKVDKNLVEIRKKEANYSGQILGVQKQIFFGYPDGKLASSNASTKGLIGLLRQVNPDIIFLPSFLDNHPDHRVTNEILINAIFQLPEMADKSKIWAYEIWTPIFPNRIIDISEVIETKKKAIQCHQSQLKSRRYDEAILGLNKYRAQINNLSGYAEAFFATTPKTYRELYKKS